MALHDKNIDVTIRCGIYAPSTRCSVISHRLSNGGFGRTTSLLDHHISRKPLPQSFSPFRTLTLMGQQSQSHRTLRNHLSPSHAVGVAVLRIASKQHLLRHVAGRQIRNSWTSSRKHPKKNTVQSSRRIDRIEIERAPRRPKSIAHAIVYVPLVCGATP